jgi:small subunit ribosomal protein S3
VVIGRSGQGTAELKELLTKKVLGKININIAEVPKPDLSASIVGQNIAYQIEKRIAFKRAIKAAIQKATEAGVLGIKVRVGGRLGGAEIARNETFSYGSIPLQTIRANIDYARVNAKTTYGIIGVKVWVYKGEVFDKKSQPKVGLPLAEKTQNEELNPTGR